MKSVRRSAAFLVAALVALPARAEVWIAVSDLADIDDATRANLDATWERTVRATVDRLGHSLATNVSLAENSTRVLAAVGRIRGRCGELCLALLAGQGDGTFVSRLATRRSGDRWDARVQLHRLSTTRLLADVTQHFETGAPDDAALADLLKRAVLALPPVLGEVPVEVVPTGVRSNSSPGTNGGVSVSSPSTLSAGARQGDVADRCRPLLMALRDSPCLLWLRPGEAEFSVHWSGALAGAKATLDVPADGGRLLVSPQDLATPVVLPVSFGLTALALTFLLPMPAGPAGIAITATGVALGLALVGWGVYAALHPPRLLELVPYAGPLLTAARARVARRLPFDGSAQKPSTSLALDPPTPAKPPVADQTLGLLLSDPRIRVTFELDGQRYPCLRTLRDRNWCLIKHVPAGTGRLELRGLDVPHEVAIDTTGPGRFYSVNYDPNPILSVLGWGAVTLLGGALFVGSLLYGQSTLGSLGISLASVILLVGGGMTYYASGRTRAPTPWTVDREADQALGAPYPDAPTEPPSDDVAPSNAPAR